MKLLTALIVAAVAAFTSLASAKELSLAYFMGPNHHLNANVFTPFAEKLAEVSGGKLTVKQFPGGALNSVPPKQYEILLNGVTDIAFHLPGYTAQIFPITISITTPGLCTNATDCTEALWRAYDYIENEYDAKILALWANDAPALYTKDVPVRTLEDLEGKIVAVTTGQDIPFIEALGASATSQPVTALNQNLANGVVDAVSVDPSASLSFKLHEPSNFMTTGYPSGGNPFVLLMSKTLYNSFTDEEKGWVDEASGKWLSLEGAKTYEAVAKKGIQVSSESGVEIISLSDGERARWFEAMQPAISDFNASNISQGLTGADVTKIMKGE